MGLQRRTVIETRAEQCEKVTAQKDCGNSNINAIKCVCAGVCRSNLYRLIVTQHGELHMWGSDDNGTVFETQGCCERLFFTVIKTVFAFCGDFSECSGRLLYHSMRK